MDVLLRWTEDLDDDRAVTLWAGLAAAESAAEREKALSRWVEWANVTIPLGIKLRDLVQAVTTLLNELEATASNADHVLAHPPQDLVPMMRALQGWMRAREAHPGAVLGAARALLRAESLLPPQVRRANSRQRESFEVIHGTDGREAISSRELSEAIGRGEHGIVVASMRRRIERASAEEAAQLFEVFLGLERHARLPSWSENALEFLLLVGDLRSAPARILASMATEHTALWGGYVRASATPRESLRAVRLLGALASHEDVARTLHGRVVAQVEAVLISALEHPRFAVWSRAARALGRLAGVAPELAASLSHSLEGASSALLRRRASAALGNLSAMAPDGLQNLRQRLLMPMITGVNDEEATLSAAALAVSLPDLAALGNTEWIMAMRSLSTRSDPDTWIALARGLREIAQRDPESVALVSLLAKDLHARVSAHKGAGVDVERVMQVRALLTRLVQPDRERTTAWMLMADMARAIERDPTAASLRAQAMAMSSEMDALVVEATRALAGESVEEAVRGAVVLDEVTDLVIDGDLEVLAERVVENSARVAMLSAADGLRARLLRMVWTGLRRPTPASPVWRRWLLRAAGIVPRVVPYEKRERPEVVREQLFETLERVADDPLLGQAALQRAVARVVGELSDALHPESEGEGRAAVLLWMLARGATLPPSGKLRKWLGDAHAREPIDRLFSLLDQLSRGGPRIAEALHGLAVLAGGSARRLGLVLGLLATESAALGQRGPERHWSGLPRFDLTDLATMADTFARVRDDATFALTPDGERPGEPSSEGLAERAGGLNRMLTSTSLKFVDAARRAEVVEHYTTELSSLAEAIASACGPVFGAAVRAPLAKAMVAVRAMASEAVTDRGGATTRYIARLKVRGELSSAHEGGMASTYLAEGPAPGKQVVVKLLPWERMRGESADAARAMFEGEMERLAAIVHPNVVSIVDAGFVEDGAYIALEYIPGASLETILSRYGALSMARVVPIVRDVARALAYLHARGIVHRDIKPANILVQFDLGADEKLDAERVRTAEIIRAVVIDFGIATESLGAGRSEGVTGTPGYIAPEVARGLDLVSSGLDTYALAVVVFELLTGRNPYLLGSDEVQAVLVRHGTLPLPTGQLPKDGVPAGLAELLTRASRFDPRQRISMREFLDRWIALFS